MFITYTEYPPNTKKVNAHNGVTSFASGYGSVRLICQQPDGKTETIILQEVVHLQGSFNLISQFQIMDKDVKVELVNHCSLNLHNCHGKLIATAPQVNGRFVLDRVLERESTEYIDIEDSCLLALTMTGHASQHDAEKRTLWHRRLAHVGLKAFEILPKVVTDALKMTRKCDCESCMKCKFARKPFTLNTTFRATEPLLLVHSDICGPLQTAIGGGRYMLFFIDDATRHMDEYILRFKSEALEKFKHWKALKEKQSGKQVKRFHTDGGGEYTSKQFAEYLKSEGILNKTTTPYTPQSNGVIERANRTIMERVRCMLDHGGLSKKYWAIAVSGAVYQKNRTSTRSVVGKTPYEDLHGRKPS
jgi:transposase InsO family protein